jgi:hypothetical protein
MNKALHPETRYFTFVSRQTVHYFPMRGGSRKAIAKNNTPRAKVKIKMYATLSISNIPDE